MATPRMNDRTKATLVWGMFIACMLVLVVVLEYRDTSKWTEAVKPALVVSTFALVVKTLVDLYSRFSHGRTFDGWTYAALAAAIGCVILLWLLGGTAKALLSVLVLSTVAAGVGIASSWITDKRGR